MLIITLLCVALSVVLKYCGLPWWNIVGGVAVFVAALNLPLKPSASLLELRSQSMWIYYTHEYVLFVFFNLLAIKSAVANPWLIMLMVFAAVAVESYVLTRLQNYQRFKFLKYLVS